MAEPEISAELLVLLQEFSRSGLRELQVRKGDFELFLSTDASASVTVSAAPAVPAAGTPIARESAPAPVAVTAPAAAAAPVSAGDLPADAFIVRAPNLGTFYRAPKPGAAFYVEIGSKVSVGDELCLIEVMKLFTSVRAELAGRVHAVLVEDGAMVEADQPLFAVVRD